MKPAIVAFLAAVIFAGAVGVTVWKAAKSEPTAPITKSPDAPAPAKAQAKVAAPETPRLPTAAPSQDEFTVKERELLDKVAKHEFWKKPMSRAEILAIAGRVRAEKNNAAIFISSACAVSVLRYEESETTKSIVHVRQDGTTLTTLDCSSLLKAQNANTRNEYEEAKKAYDEKESAILRQFGNDWICVDLRGQKERPEMIGIVFTIYKLMEQQAFIAK